MPKKWVDVDNMAGRKLGRVRYIEFDGEKKSLRKWVEDLGINYHTIYGRLRKGWSIERAFTEPVRQNPVR